MHAVVEHLLGHDVPFLALPAPSALAPADVARRHGLDPSELVWTELVMTAKGPVAMAVGAGRSLDLERARLAVADPTARIASHEEIRALAKGCEAGAVPPLSSFLDMPVYVDVGVARLEHVVFPAGSVHALVCIAREDLVAVEPMRVATLTADPAPAQASVALSVVAPSRRAAFTGEALVPFHLRAG